MQQRCDQRAHQHDGDFMVVINELLLAGDDLGGKGQHQEGGHGREVIMDITQSESPT